MKQGKIELKGCWDGCCGFLFSSAALLFLKAFECKPLKQLG